MVTEIKIPAFPVLEPLTKATETSLAPLYFYPGDFLEIDIDEKGRNFIVHAVGLRKASGRELPSDEIKVVTTSEGVFYRENGRSGYPSNAAAIRWFKKIPEKSQKGYGLYHLAATDFTALVIHHVWSFEKLIWLSEEAWLTYCIILKRFLVQCKAAEIVARWNIDKAAPTMPKDFIEHPELPLGPYQKAALLASLSQFSYALFMQQGTGKTPIVINRICLEGSRKKKGKLPGRKQGMYRALIICPKQVRRNWENEFFRFSTSPGKIGSLRGGRISKMKELIDATRNEEDCDWSASIISIDSVQSIQEALTKLKWDLVVIDESHKIKSSGTKRFKTMMQFTERHTYAKMILTGTPIANTIFDLWAQMEWLGSGLSGFNSYKNYKGFHGKWAHKQSGGPPVLTAYKAIPLLQERLARLAFLITKKEAGLNLPDKVYDTYEVSMTPDQKKIYLDIANKLRVEIKDILATTEAQGKAVTVGHILVKLLRLAQITSGFVATDETVDIDTLEVSGRELVNICDPNPKLEAVIDMLKEDQENDPNSKAIIWCCFIQDIRNVSQRLHDAGIKHVGYHRAIHSDHRVSNTDDAEAAINLDPECRVLVANPASAGVGQNYVGYDVTDPDKYPTYVDHEIYFSCNWNAVDRSQSEDRAHRRGTRTNVRITDLVVPYTIDEEIRTRVKGKRNIAMTVQDVHEILNTISNEGY